MLMEKSPPDPKEAPSSKEKDISPYWSRFHRSHKLASMAAHPGRPEKPRPEIIQGHARRYCNRLLVPYPLGPTPQTVNPKTCFQQTSHVQQAEFTESAATPTQARKIRVYPTKDQRRILKLWFDAARWCYNETVARLKADPELKANWRAIKTDIINAVPERLKEAPYQVKSIAVRDACRAMSEVKRRNKAAGTGTPARRISPTPLPQPQGHPKQGCYIPKRAVTGFGAYYTILGNLRMTEGLPEEHGDSRLTLHNGQYHLAVTMPAERQPGRDPSPRRRPGARHPQLPHLVLGNRFQPHRPRRLRQDPTPLPPPR